MKERLTMKKFSNAMAFVALIIAGIALLISKIFLAQGSVAANVLNNIAYCLAFLVTAICAFFYVRTKRNIVYTIIYIVAIIIVIVPIVLSMFNI